MHFSYTIALLTASLLTHTSIVVAAPNLATRQGPLTDCYQGQEGTQCYPFAPYGATGCSANLYDLVSLYRICQ